MKKISTYTLPKRQQTKTQRFTKLLTNGLVIISSALLFMIVILLFLTLIRLGMWILCL